MGVGLTAKARVYGAGFLITTWRTLGDEYENFNTGVGEGVF